MILIHFLILRNNLPTKASWRNGFCKLHKICRYRKEQIDLGQRVGKTQIQKMDMTGHPTKGMNLILKTLSCIEANA
jgi:hypothetical protein